MFCPKCGRQNQPTSRFCSKCGFQLPNAAVHPHTPQYANQGFLPPGTIIEGKYRIEGKIGSGGMGDVYRAQRLLVGDQVAIKILKPHLAADRQASERFRREAMTASQLRHRNIVGIFDVGVLPGTVTPFILMELARGTSLRTIVSLPTLPSIEFSVAVVAQVAAGLSEAHSRGIVHRDIKPENIIAHQSASGWNVQVLDFGIAKPFNQQNTGLTLDGTSVGTPNYMSPEQCLGHELDARSDLYSLAVVTYELLTGRVPFISESMSAVVVHHVQTPPPPPRTLNPTISEEVESVVMRALRKDRNERYASVAEYSRTFIAAVAGSIRSTMPQMPVATPAEIPVSKPASSNEPLEESPPDDPDEAETADREPPVVTPRTDTAPEEEEEEEEAGNAPDEERSSTEVEDITVTGEATKHWQEHEIETEDRGEDGFAYSNQPSTPEDESERTIETGENHPVPTFEEERGDADPPTDAPTEQNSEEERLVDSERQDLNAEVGTADDSDSSGGVREPSDAGELTDVNQAATDSRSGLITLFGDIPPAESGDPESSSGVPALSGKILAVGAVCLILIVILGIVTLTSGSDVLTGALLPDTGSDKTKVTVPEGMVLVTAGGFTMGADDQRYSRPARRVVMKAFFIDVTEVTNEDFKKFVDATGHRVPRSWRRGTFPKGRERHPVSGVDFESAVAYAQWVGKRLPTEEEWEYAARGSDGRKYPWGNDWRKGAANVASGGPAEVGKSEGKSPFGLLDVSGNVWEWTSSDAQAYPGGDAFPSRTREGQKIIRGGSWQGGVSESTVYFRKPFSAKASAPGTDKIGFRCVKDVP